MLKKSHLNQPQLDVLPVTAQYFVARGTVVHGTLKTGTSVVWYNHTGSPGHIFGLHSSSRTIQVPVVLKHITKGVHFGCEQTGGN